jgi:hypothetical protein
MPSKEAFSRPTGPALVSMSRKAAYWSVERSGSLATMTRP